MTGVICVNESAFHALIGVTINPIEINLKFAACRDLLELWLNIATIFVHSTFSLLMMNLSHSVVWAVMSSLEPKQHVLSSTKLLKLNQNIQQLGVLHLFLLCSRWRSVHQVVYSVD
jgi:hypothetical protein